MKIEITTSEKAIEIANTILFHGIAALEERPDLMEQMNLSKKDLKIASGFREALLKSFKSFLVNEQY